MIFQSHLRTLCRKNAQTINKNHYKIEMAFKFSGGHMRVKYKQANANYIIIRNNYYFDDEKK